MNNLIYPQVGVGVIIVNPDQKILIKKRLGKHAPKYSIPGGKLDLGETFESAAIREIKEETNLEIKNPKVIAVSNNLETYQEEGVHFISVILATTQYSGELKNLEPEKCEQLLWCDPHQLPQPHFDGSRLGVECYLQSSFYLGFK